MRWLALLLTSTFAFADKPVRKPAPPNLDADRLSNFVDALMADKAGEYETAISRYRSAADRKDHAAIVYNIADLQRRSEDYEEAIKGYKKYLELEPNAKDKAAVLKLVADLEKMPQRIVVDGEDLDAVVFIDGKPAGPSPLATTLTEGEHVVDRIGPESYTHDIVRAKPLGHRHITGYRDLKGNVVMSTSSHFSGSWKDGEIEYRMNDRFTLPPGRYDTFFFSPGRACSPLSFQVPPSGLVYVFVDAPEDRKRPGCTPIKITTQKIQFPEKS